MRRHCLRRKFYAIGVVRHGSPRVFTTIDREISSCERKQVYSRSAQRMPFQDVRNHRKFFCATFSKPPAGICVVFFFFFFFFVYPRFASLKETIVDLETHHFRMSTIRSISVSPYAEWEKSRLLPNDKQPFLNIIETGEVWL